MYRLFWCCWRARGSRQMNVPGEVQDCLLLSDLTQGIFMHNYNYLWDEIVCRVAWLYDGIHGESHWKRVEKRGLFLSKRTGANVDVIRLFALFHDAGRFTNDEDYGHGERGALLAKEYYGKYFFLNDEQMELLIFACTHHEKGFISDDVTVGSCWDADRLDLGRVGEAPHPRFMSTNIAKNIVFKLGAKSKLNCSVNNMSAD